MVTGFSSNQAKSREETAQNTSADLLYDEWDRVIRSVSGLSSGDYAPVGSGFCATAGARTERAFDAAGHLIRERSLQDFVDQGGLGCRWVESFYTYNAREQVVEVRQTHLSDPGQPGAVSLAAKLVGSAVFDSFGRLKESHAHNQVDGAVVTHYRYDAAGRSVGVKVGESSERVQAFDAKNRVVYRSDGHQAVWRGRFDAWDRIWIEQQPTGAFEQHSYDKANNLTETLVWDRDPKLNLDTRVLLKATKTSFNSFGEVSKVSETLTAGSEPQKRVTVRELDSAGRVKLVLSGPGTLDDQLIREEARREKEIGYEAETGRVLYEASGGLADEPPLFERRFLYEPKTPWPHQILFFEKVPGDNQLVETQSSRFDYDAMGRVVKEERNDGSKVETIYDRMSGQPIQVTTGAGAVSTVSYDGAGRQVRTTRPNNRGETLYAYDLDGRLRQQVTKTESTDWTTSHGYDAIGRPIRVDYQDGSFETTTWNPDSTVATRRTRDGLTLTYTYDAANRPLSVVPSGAVAATLEPLDAGDETSWDALSRPTAQRRGEAGLTVAYPSYDLGGRPAEEKVGDREALGWAWDIYNQAIETRLPTGIGRSAGSFTGFQRQFNTLNQLTGIGALGAEPQSVQLGASWSVGGSGRLWGMTTKGSLGTAVRYGYLGGAGAQPPAGNSSDSKWKLGTMTWGSMPVADSESTATQTPGQIWGQFAFGYRGNEGDPRDGVKVGRLAVKTGGDLFAGTGWSWSYDAGVRLSEATGGRGDLLGGNPDNDPSFHYRYGKGDELQQIVDEASGKVAGIETGAYGRIMKRNGISFSYDNAGRRTEDDRFEYKWNWRGELVEVTVKASWPEGQNSPFAGHQVSYRYDAQGRLNSRSHYGPLEGQAGRLLQEKRVYVWEGQSLLVEAAYADEGEISMLWRKTYIPGPGGLDDAVQVKVDNVAAPGIAGSRLYTYVRDELGTVIGVVGEEESNNSANPYIPARYLYSPYGEAHIEKALEIRRVRFEEAEDQLGSQSQQIEDPDEQCKGALIVTFAASLDAASLATGVVVEMFDGVEWVALAAQDLLVGYDDATDLKVLAREGWERGASYRVRLTTALKDKQGRSLAQAQIFDWWIAASGSSSDFSRSFAVEYETAKASLDTLGGRFPGGQNNLFQGLWSDPVTGMSYARARWYDGRNAGWLSEDPVGNRDSTNLYSFVGFTPNLRIDPRGLLGVFLDGTWNDRDNVPPGEVFTNVERLRRLYGEDFVYISGVGTRTNIVSSLWGGAMGTGMEERVLEAWAAMGRAYRNGDRNFDIFGFSRGAAEARMLVNLVYKYGLFDPDRDPISQELRAFETREGVIYANVSIFSQEPMVEGRDVNIRFLGLFDTVDSRATGYLEGYFSNPDQAIPPIVQAVRHAIASDEYRQSYGVVALQRPNCPANARLVERQFRGSHSDIGGGYFDWTLSLVPLEWMWNEADRLDVPLNPIPPMWRVRPGMSEEDYLGSRGDRHVHDSTNFWKDPLGYVTMDYLPRPYFYPAKCVGEP